MKLSTRGPKPNTQTAVILAMWLDGYDRKYIARELGTRYQNVYKAIKRFNAIQGVHELTENGLVLKQRKEFTDSDQHDIVHSEAARRGVCQAGDGRTKTVLPGEQDNSSFDDSSGEDVEGWVSPFVLRNLETGLR